MKKTTTKHIAPQTTIRRLMRRVNELKAEIKGHQSRADTIRKLVRAREHWIESEHLIDQVDHVAKMLVEAEDTLHALRWLDSRAEVAITRMRDRWVVICRESKPTGMEECRLYENTHLRKAITRAFRDEVPEEARP